MICRNGAGNLAKGEKYVIDYPLYCHVLIILPSRYCSVDFVIFATLMGVILLQVVLTYNIVCQWSKNFCKCMEQFPPEMQILDSIHVDMAIPGWHINGHGDACRNNFNLSYMEGVGRTVGEDIETTWVGMNPLAASVREMGLVA